jgi:hypothetical protein
VWKGQGMGLRRRLDFGCDEVWSPAWPEIVVEREEKVG